jgi:hypothetical protein
MGLSGAASGASNALQEILARAFAEKQAQAQLALQQQALQQRTDADQQDRNLRIRNFDADEQYRQGQVARQGRQDDVAATERRQAENQRGVRRMIGDFLVQRGATPLDTGARQTLQGMAIQEDVDLPKQIADDPTAANAEWERRQGIEHKNRLGEIGATTAGQERVARVRADETRQTQAAKASLGATTGAGNEYSTERAQRTIQDVDEVIPMINSRTSGFGSVLSSVPGTDARRVAGKLKTLSANIAFNELTAMRNASKTGGALGAVSDREAQLLTNSLGAIDQGLDGADLVAELNKIKESVNRWEQARKTAGVTGAPAMATSHAPSQAAPTVQKWGRDAQGRPVPIK